MAVSDSTSITVGSIALSLISTLTIPATVATVKKLQSPTRDGYGNLKKLYEDEDGVATTASEKTFSAALSVYFILAGSFLGLIISLATAIQSTIHHAHVIESWLAFGSWVLLLFQAATIFRERRPIKRFNGAFASAASYFILILCFCWQNWPTVFSDGQAVDGQFTVSALSRWTFSWVDELLAFAKINSGLEMTHLPQLHLRGRSKYLEWSFNEKKRSHQLWKDLLRVHRLELFGQSLLVMTQGIIQFAPQLAMYKLLGLIERRSVGEAIASEAWSWTLALGISIILTAWVEAFMHWVVWARMGSLIRSELSALIFSKSIRSKDVKIHHKAMTEGNVDANGATETTANGSLNQKPANQGGPIPIPLDDEADEEVQKSRQSVINLIAIDTKRIADLALNHWIFSQTIAKLAVSIIFLVNLIGWPSLLAGFAVAAVTMPLNIWASRSYSKTQTGLMKARDQKMVVVTEALQGIRQIKFSALESQWQAKIGMRRVQELAIQWKAFAVNTVLIGIWILGPVMLSAVSLAVFAILHGDLSPSIAFTTITVFGQIEMTLAVVPEWVSDVLDEYLAAPEKEEYTTPSDEVAFEDAVLAWPSDSGKEDPDRFVLRNVNLQFPARKLSVISGRTGSAILGEAERISGVIKVPQPPVQRYDQKANKSNWIIDSAFAFVSQIPWIENATIKDNILFGLPFEKDRYNKVLSSCALTRDLEMLPDGELTDIGANGINLSGGQRWRVTLARALYSRAGILVLDDIFSAVDAHVGRQLFEEALTGELGNGRTRILVTHHVSLCLPKTTYAVSLEAGTVERAGYVEDLDQKGLLDQILSKEEDLQANDVKEVEQLTIQFNDGDDTLRKILTTVTELSVKTDDSEVDTKGKGQPKRFTEEERREKGSVKFSIWKEYLGSSGAREAKRLESNAKSPIFEQFGSALAGIGTIRAYDKADAYVDR
ncbi:MAG: hypothetical protein Q9201_004535 [Fulgogasparrea decipioides]